MSLPRTPKTLGEILKPVRSLLAESKPVSKEVSPEEIISQVVSRALELQLEKIIRKSFPTLFERDEYFNRFANPENLAKYIKFLSENWGLVQNTRLSHLSSNQNPSTQACVLLAQGIAQVVDEKAENLLAPVAAKQTIEALMESDYRVTLFPILMSLISQNKNTVGIVLSYIGVDDVLFSRLLNPNKAFPITLDDVNFTLSKELLSSFIKHYFPSNQLLMRIFLRRYYDEHTLFGSIEWCVENRDFQLAKILIELFPYQTPSKTSDTVLLKLAHKGIADDRIHWLLEKAGANVYVSSESWSSPALLLIYSMKNPSPDITSIIKWLVLEKHFNPLICSSSNSPSSLRYNNHDRKLGDWLRREGAQHFLQHTPFQNWPDRLSICFSHRAFLVYENEIIFENEAQLIHFINNLPENISIRDLRKKFCETFRDWLDEKKDQYQMEKNVEDNLSDIEFKSQHEKTDFCLGLYKRFRGEGVVQPKVFATENHPLTKLLEKSATNLQQKARTNGQKSWLNYYVQERVVKRWL